VIVAGLIISGAAIVVSGVSFYLHWRWRDWPF
jgi:hypothetical protein